MGHAATVALCNAKKFTLTKKLPSVWHRRWTSAPSLQGPRRNAITAATIDQRFSTEGKDHGQKITDRGYKLGNIVLRGVGRAFARIVA
jgi:hypothetical protein